LRDRLQAAGLEPMESFAWGFPFQNLYRTAVRIASRAAIPDSPRPAEPGRVTRVLSGGYTLFGNVMLPLFFLNLPWLGEQIVAVARRRA
jgi:hypothetical protein